MRYNEDMSKILVVEDDEHVGNMLEEILRPQYAVVRAYSGTEALLAVRSAKPDLVLLDLMLPGASGEDILPQILPVPVIIVSAKPDPEQKAELLLRGAGDYIAKPFHPKELLARVAVQLRTAPPAGPWDECLGISLQPDLLTAAGQNGETKLTRTEMAIARLLFAEPTRIFSKSGILDAISADTPDCTESSLKAHVSNLRRKLRGIGAPDGFIESVWGVGYRLMPPPKS